MTVDTYYNGSSKQNESYVDLYYSKGPATIDVYMYQLPEGSAFYGFGQEMPVNNRAGYFESYGDSYGNLNFACGDLDYSIYGPLSRSELVSIGESVQCDMNVPNTNQNSDE